MTKTIHKFIIIPGQSISAPNGKVLLVGHQPNWESAPTIWIEHDPDATPMTDYFIRPTGARFMDEGRDEHVGSAICGDFVWHVYRAR